MIEVGLSKRVTQLKWHTLSWNTPAIKFYKKFGAVEYKDYLKLYNYGDPMTFRLSFEDMEKLALGGDNHD
jgi:hypothetical protein